MVTDAQPVSPLWLPNGAATNLGREVDISRPTRGGRGYPDSVDFHAETVTRTTGLSSGNQQKSAPFDAIADGMHTEVALFDAWVIDEWTGTSGCLETEWRWVPQGSRERDVRDLTFPLTSY